MWSVKILVLALLLASVKAVNRDMQHDELTGHISSTYEEIMSTRKLRKQQFGDMLEGFKDQLEKHNSGELLLTKKEFDRINNKIKVYTNKLDELDLDKDPRFVDRIIAREAHLNEVTRQRILRRATGSEL